MFRKANNVFSVILDNETVAPLAAASIATDVTLPAGAIAVVDLGMKVLDNAAYVALPNGAQFMVVQGKGVGAPMMKSPVLTKGRVVISSAKHVASVQQITAIGSNGTTGSLPSANDTSYHVKVRKNDNDAANRSQPFSLFGQYKTSGSATQIEVAEGLIKNGNKNMADEPANGYLYFDMLIDTAAANTELGGLGNPTGNLVVTKGSPVVTMADTQDLTAGDYLRFAVDATETVTDAVYRIASVDSATQITLTFAYQGASNTSYDDDFVHLIPKATGDADNFGIRLTGVEAPFNVNSFRNFYVNRFTATFSDEDTLVTHVQGAREGVGVWQRVALDEYMSYGYEGQNEMINIPPMMRDQVVKIPGVGGATAATSKYSVVNISWTEDIDGLVSKAGGKGNVLIYVNLDGSGNLGGAGSSGEATVVTLGITAANLDE
jgi:hypothetical protein